MRVSVSTERQRDNERRSERDMGVHDQESGRGKGDRGRRGEGDRSRPDEGSRRHREGDRSRHSW